MVRHFALVAALLVPSIDAFINRPAASRPDSARRIHFDDFGDLGVTSPDDDGGPPPRIAGDADSGASPPDGTGPRPFERLESVLLGIYGPGVSSETSRRLAATGFADDDEVVHFARGFASREERISTALIDDFGWAAMDAHRARVGIVGLLAAAGGGGADRRGDRESRAGGRGGDVEGGSVRTARRHQLHPNVVSTEASDEGGKGKLSQATPAGTEDSRDGGAPPEGEVRASWKSVVINDKARLRMAGGKARDQTAGSDPSESKTKTSGGAYSYGLLPHTEDNADRTTYRTLYEELDALWTHMTVQQASSVSGEWRRPVMTR